jgi:hypothetical protein
MSPSFTDALVLQKYKKTQLFCTSRYLSSPMGATGNVPPVYSIGKANNLVISVVPTIPVVTAFQSFQLSGCSGFLAISVFLA